MSTMTFIRFSRRYLAISMHSSLSALTRAALLAAVLYQQTVFELLTNLKTEISLVWIK